MNQTKESVAAQVATLPTLAIKELWGLWDQHFHTRPENPNRAYLQSRLAYRLQEQAFGCLPTETRQRLIAIGKQHSKIPTRQPSQQIELAPGTVLLREWGDRDHRVVVTAAGHFEYEGQQFKSLSAVARFITGTPWSGPVFFNLKTKAAA